MPSRQAWDLTVPADPDELLDEFRRHGVRPGQRIHVLAYGAEVADPEGPPAFFASFSGPADLAESSCG